MSAPSNDRASARGVALEAHAGLITAAALIVGAGVLLVACGPPKVDDPIATLSTTDSTPGQYARAMELLDETPNDPAYIQALRRMLHVPGYTVRTREMALDRLAVVDPDAMLRTLEVQLPRLGALEWRRRLCEIIAERGWTELGPTLIVAWAQPMDAWVPRDEERPERKALERLFASSADGRELSDYLLQVFVETRSPAQQNLRARSWEMLLRIGERERLATLLAQTEVSPDDALLADLRAGVVDLGVFPETREEILWLRSLRQPEHAAHWSEAREAIAALSPERRAGLELRDVAIVIAAARHRRDLLDADERELYARLDAYLRSPAAGRTHMMSFEGTAGHFRQRLHEWRDQLTWSDLVAMHLAISALQVPQLVDHLFDYADRDHRDRTTEYGGLIRLDDRGRFELVEYPPRVRGNDERFETPPEMMTDGYTALFHFHYHATRHDNARWAAPGTGDLRYAELTRVNALVFTFIDRRILNVDFYRHSGVSVDLGEIRRP